jgi:hypothetical protein
MAGIRTSEAMDFVRVGGHIHRFLGTASAAAHDPARVGIRTIERLTILIVSPSNL